MAGPYATQDYATDQKREPQVSQAALELEKACANLTETASMLVGRISAVLIPCPPPVESGKAGPVPVSPKAPMAEVLEARTREIQRVIHQLTDAFQRCEA